MAPSKPLDALDFRHRGMILRSLKTFDRSNQLLRRTTELLRQSLEIREMPGFQRQQNSSSRFLVPRKSHIQLQNEFNQSGFDFLMVDIDAGIAFARLAASHTDAETRTRNTKKARRAYDSVNRLRKRLSLSAGQQKGLDERRLNLRKVLKSLGEHFQAERVFWPHDPDSPLPLPGNR